MSTQNRPPQIARKLAAALIAAVMAFPPGAIGSAWAQDFSVTGVDVNPDQVKISLSGPADYKDFVLSNPPRIVIQLNGTSYQLSNKIFPGKGGGIKEVRSGQFAKDAVPVSRIVVDLSQAIAYHIIRDGNNLLVHLAASAAPEVTALPHVAPAAASPTRSAEAPQDPPDPPGTQAEMQNFDIISRLPRDKVTIDFDETDIKDIMQLFSAKAKINIIYGQDVTGDLTLHLANVPFNEAFRTVLNMMGLTTTQVGSNILRVLTPDALSRVQTQAATATKVISLNYASAADMVKTITQIQTAEKIPGASIADTKTNSIIITESPDSLVETAQLVQQLDVRPKQVLIEAKLVEVSLDTTFDYGIQWNSLTSNTNQSGTTYSGTPVSVTPSGSATNLNTTSLLSNQQTITVPPVGANGSGTGVSLPTVVPAFGALTLGRITNNYILNATLTAAASQGKVKILSDPKIATLNNEPANINVTTQIPYVTSTVVAGNAGGTVPQTVSYVTEGIQLTVTPIINADGRITLTINPNISQPSATAAGNALTGAPAIDARSAQTTVMVKDGETIVIGGLIHDSVTDQIGEVPLLGDIPIIGWLFKNKHFVHSRNELLIFVTPKITED